MNPLGFNAERAHNERARRLEIEQNGRPEDARMRMSEDVPHGWTLRGQERIDRIAEMRALAKDIRDQIDAGIIGAYRERDAAGWEAGADRLERET